MSAITPEIKTIFGRALEIESHDERLKFLNEACGENADLRREVDALLNAHDGAGSFMKTPMRAEDDATAMHIPMKDLVGTTIGPYKLLQKIGEGGFGVVYMAEQHRPVRRKVALKIIKPGMDTREVIARFEAERQALALMDHPNIAHVLDGGATDEGRPYFVMELVRGVPLTEFCDANKLAPRERLELFITVCQAIQHAHQKGVIHRDIKPTNVMVTLHDGEPVPKVIDFGVAKATQQQLTERTMFTAYGQMIGTPQYMSPEQAEMSGLDIDTRSDVYSLGVMLYELLTGSPPLDTQRLKSAAYAEVQKMIREEEPHKPSTKISTLGAETANIASRRGTDSKKLAALLKGDLDWIVMKALEKNRNRRYETANGLAMDVERYLKNEPVVARPPSMWYLLSKTASRNKAAFAAGSVMMLAVLVGLAAVTWGYVEANRQRDAVAAALGEAETQRDAAQEARQKAEAETARAETAEELASQRADDLGRQFYNTNFERAAAAFHDGASAEVQHWLDACPEDRRDWEWRRLHYANSGTGWTRDTNITGIYWMAISPDRRRVVMPHADTLSGLTMLDTRTGEIVWQLPNAHGDEVGGTAFSRDGSMVISTADDGRVRLWNAEDGSHIRDFAGFNASASIMQADFSFDDQLIAAGGGDHKNRGVGDFIIRVWERATGKLVGELEGHEAKIRRLVFSPNDHRLYSCDFSGTYFAWDVSGMKELYRVKTGQGTTMCLAISRDGQTVATGGFDQTLKLWRSADGSPLKTLGQPKTGAPDWSGTWGIAFSPDGRRVVTGERDGKYAVHVWDVNRGILIDIFRGHHNSVFGVVFAEDSESVISGDYDGVVTRWAVGSISRTREGVPLRMHRGEQLTAAFSGDGRHLATGGDDGQLFVRDADTLEPVRRMETVGEAGIDSVALSPDGQRVASATSTGLVSLWDQTSGKLLWEYEVAQSDDAGEPADEAAPFAADEQGSNATAAEETATQKRIRTTCVAFGPQGKVLLVGGADGALVVLDTKTGKPLQQRKMCDRPVHCFAVSSRGQVVCQAYDAVQSEYSVFFTDLELTEPRVLTFPGGGISAQSAPAFSEDGERLVFAIDDTTHVYDVATAAEVQVLQGTPFAAITAVAFSPDDRRVIWSEGKGKVRVWDIESNQEILRLRDNGAEVTAICTDPAHDRLLIAHRDEDVPYALLLETASPESSRRRELAIQALHWIDSFSLEEGFGLKSDLLATISQSEDETITDEARAAMLRIVSQVYPEAIGSWHKAKIVLGDEAATEEKKQLALRWAEAAARSQRFEPLLHLGLAHELLGDETAAKEAFRQAAQQDSLRTGQFWAVRGTVQLAGDKWAEALPFFDRAIALDPVDAWHWFFRGQAKRGLGDATGALADFDRAIELNNVPTAFWRNRSELRAKQGDSAGADADAKQASRREHGGVSRATYWRLEADKRELVQDWAGSVACYTKAIELNPPQDAWWNNRGRAKHNLKDYEGAILDYSKSLEIDQDYITWNNRGVAKHRLEDYEGAIADFNKAIDQKPEIDYHWGNRGLAKRLLENYEGAIADYDKAIEMKSTNAYSWNGRGYAKHLMEDFESAIVDFSRAIELAPDKDLFWKNRGLSKLQFKDYAGAIADYDQAIELNPKEAAHWNNRGAAKEKLENFEGALTDYDKAIELKPDVAMYWNNRGWAKNRLEDYQAAILDHDKAIELAPDVAMHWSNRGETKGELKDHAGEIADLDKAIELEPENAEFWNNRGWAKVEAEDWARALADCDRAVELDPTQPNYLDSRVAALVGLGRYEKAVADALKTVEIASDEEKANYTETLACTALSLLEVRQYALALQCCESCLPLRKKFYPDDHESAWMRYQTESLLGGALLGLERYEAAEPHLLAGYEGLTARAEQIPEDVRAERIEQARNRLARLYEATDRADEAAELHANNKPAVDLNKPMAND